MTACKHRQVARAWVCFDCGVRFVPDPHQTFPAEAHDAPRGAQEAESGASGAKPAPDATAVDTPSHFEPYDAETVALVRRLRGVLHDVGMEEDITKNYSLTQERAFRARDAADAWLAAHDKLIPDAPTYIVERWEPCAMEHVETKDGRWLRQSVYSSSHQEPRPLWYFCPGEHRRRHEGCCTAETGMVPPCKGTGWERIVN